MAAAASSDSHEAQIREMKRDLQRRIDRVRPIIQQMESGELKVLSDTQQKQIELYPTWMSDMESLKNGILPAKKATEAAAAKATPQKKSNGTADSNNAVIAASPSLSGGSSPDNKKTGKQLKREKSQQNRDRRLQAAAALEHDSERLQLLQQLRRATTRARNAIIDSHLRTILDMKPLALITREYENICTLRREVHSGRIAQPSNAQLAKIQMLESVKREMALEEEKLAAQRERLKASLLAEMEDLIAAEQQEMQKGKDDDEDDDEEVAQESTPPKTTGGPDEAGATKSSEEADVAPELAVESQEDVAEAEEEAAPAVAPVEESAAIKHEKTNGHPIVEQEKKTTAAAPQPELEEEEEEEEEEPAAAGGNDDDDDNMFGGFADVFSVAKQKKAKKATAVAPAPAAAPAAPAAVAPSKPAAAEDDEDSPTQAAADQQEVAPEEASPPPPPVKKEIDWSELSYKKNRPKLVFQSVQVLQEAAAAAAAAATTTGAGGSGGDTNKATAVARSASPSSSHSRQFNDLTIGRFAKPQTTSTITSQQQQQKPAAAPAAQKGGKQQAAGGKQQAAASPASPPAATQSQHLQTTIQRVARDALFCQRNPIPNVRFRVAETNALEWHVNVSPTDGPLCGTVIHLLVKFDHTYPTQPPVVTAPFEIPHPSFITIAGTRNALCLAHTMSEEWEPAYGAFSILSQLQSVFSDESFSKAKMALAGDFKSRAATCRAELSRYRCAGCSHCPEAPDPSLPLFNGPFQSVDFNRIRAGALHGPGKFSWAHRYALEGLHTFTVLVERGNTTITLQNATTGSGDGEEGGSAWVFDSATGNLTNPSNEVLKPSASLQQQQAHGVKYSFSFSESALTITADSVALHTSVPLAPWQQVRPVINLQRNKDAVSVAFAVDNDNSNFFFPSPAEDKTAAASSSSSDLRCFFSLATLRDDVLGYIIEITRGKDGAVPVDAAISQPSSDLVSIRAFEGGLRGKRLWGKRMDGVLPLLLDAENAARALPELKKQVTLMCRNPTASSSYTPPYRPANALLLFPPLLVHLVKLCTRNPTLHADEAFSIYTRVFQCFAALAMDSSQIVADATVTADKGESPSGVIFALSPIVDHPWPSVVELALRAELRGTDLQGMTTDADLFSAIPRARRRQFCTAACFARALRRASLQKLVGELAEFYGDAAPEALTEVVTATQQQIPAISSWDGLCSFLGVNLSLKDLVN